MSKPPNGVRFGGREAPGGFLFELSGGALCLDFANTIDGRPTARPLEHLETYADLVAWAEQAGAFTAEEARRLRRAAERRPKQAQAVLRRARALREGLFRAFSAVAAGERAPAGALDRLNAALGAALRGPEIAVTPRGYALRWPRTESLDAVLGLVARSAAALLVSEERPRVRECASSACAWLFLDHSRNGSRRWCDMTVCGNRAKARRHRQRVRKAAKR
jgi:predicted RNA-binding Zn ribbon-like protein